MIRPLLCYLRFAALVTPNGLQIYNKIPREPVPVNCMSVAWSVLLLFVFCRRKSHQLSSIAVWHFVLHKSGNLLHAGLSAKKLNELSPTCLKPEILALQQQTKL